MTRTGKVRELYGSNIEARPFSRFTSRPLEMRSNALWTARADAWGEQHVDDQGNLRETITHQGRRDAWVCVCGNEPHNAGFYPCDETGSQVEPDEDWTRHLFVCDECGRIINYETLGVIGKAS